MYIPRFFNIVSKFLSQGKKSNENMNTFRAERNFT